MNLNEIEKKMFRVTYVTKDSAPDQVPYYEPTVVRAIDKKAARAEANAQIEDKHKSYVKLDTIKAHKAKH